MSCTLTPLRTAFRATSQALCAAASASARATTFIARGAAKLFCCQCMGGAQVVQAPARQPVNNEDIAGHLHELLAQPATGRALYLAEHILPMFDNFACDSQMETAIRNLMVRLTGKQPKDLCQAAPSKGERPTFEEAVRFLIQKLTQPTDAGDSSRADRV